MKQIPVHYFIGGNFVGTGYQEEQFRGKKGYSPLTFWSPNSFAYFCTECGEIWARGLSEHPNASHHVQTIKCPLHGGGSFIQTVPSREFKYLPHTKEFILHELSLWERDPMQYKKRDLISQQD